MVVHLNSLKQKELSNALLALNTALTKKVSCSQQEIALLKAVLEDIERRIEKDVVAKVNFLENAVEQQNSEIIELKQSIKGFERLFKKHAERIEKEQKQGFAALTRKQKEQFADFDDTIEQKFNELDAKVFTDIGRVNSKIEKGNAFATKTFKSLMVEVANNNQRDTSLPKSYLAGGMAAGSIMALCLTVWLSLGTVQTGIENQSQEIAGLFDIGNTEDVAIVVNETGKTGLGVFDEKTAFTFIKNGLGENVSFEQMPAIKQASVEESFPLKPKMGSNAVNYASSFDAGDRDFLDELEEEAKQGNPWAQHDLALALYTGKDSEKNLETATKLFKQAAMQGVPNAQYNLAVIYHKNVGNYKDLEKAIFWYEQAAAQNHPQAMYNLAVAYGDGLGVEIDYNKAMAYFKKSYDKGIKDAAYYVAAMEEVGVLNDDKPDYVQAQIWYEKAAEAGNSQALAALDRMVSENKIASSVSGNSVRALNAIETAGE